MHVHVTCKCAHANACEYVCAYVHGVAALRVVYTWQIQVVHAWDTMDKDYH